jgi:hypothetical protein
MNIELRSTCFVFRLNTVKGLSAESWENRLTGRRVALGGGPELELDIGENEQVARKVEFEVVQLPEETGGEQPSGEAVFKLKAKEHPISATVTYRWDDKQPVLRKFVEVVNDGDRELNRLLNVRLGTYRTDSAATDGARGFPVYLDGERFLTLAHPSGWATADGGELSLRHYPGTKLAAGQSFTCMETVYGVGQAGSGRDAFLKYLTGRMRRVVRGHDKPYAIFESFGGDPNGQYDAATLQFKTNEAFVLENIENVAQGQRESGCRFDYYAMEFWHDVHGDLTGFDPVRFPNGFAKIKQALAATGMKPGLWIDSGGLPHWTCGKNPAIKPAMTQPDGGGIVCRATEPANSVYIKAFLHHIRENGVRLFKFDNMGPDCKEPVCNNPNHAHLPGIYSTEAIHNSLIEFLRILDKECPEVLLMLYWGYKSPWWLLYGDTLFESGLHIEAASVSSQPAPYARDSVTQRLDQGLKNSGDIPLLGKDSLGIWLSDWSWNSCVGNGQWQEGLVMDLCRGGLLAQVWTDTHWLTPPERAQMAEFLALFRAQPGCFRNRRPIVGDPDKDEPYGYCCSDGKRAFLAIHNACLWKDHAVTLELNSKWGLPDGMTWDIYRWHPAPARLTGEKAAFGESASLWLRPFEVVLLEIVPAGEPPALSRTWQTARIPSGFAEPTRVLALADATRPAAACAVIPPAAKGGTLVAVAPGFLAGKLDAQLDGGPVTAVQICSEYSYWKASWQAWRIQVGPTAGPRQVEVAFQGKDGKVEAATWKMVFIPAQE